MHQVLRVGRSRPCRDPETWTEAELIRFMVHVQGLRRKSKAGRESTALNRARYLRQLTREGVDLRPPTESSWLDWVDKRLDDGLHIGSLDNHRKALLSLFAFLGLDLWPCLETPYPRSLHEWELVPDRFVSEMCVRRDLHPTPYLGELVRALLRWSYRTGCRPPSELATLTLDDLDRATGRVSLWESKKDKPRRIGPLRGDILSELFEFIDGPRADVAAPQQRAVFVGLGGNRMHPTYLARLMRDAGRMVWPAFHPYQCRYWYATRRLLQTGLNVYIVARELGDSVQTVEKHYLHRMTADQALPLHGVAAGELVAVAAQ